MDIDMLTDQISDVSPTLKSVRADLPRINILGVAVNVMNMTDAVELSDSLIRSGGKGYVCVTDVHGVIEAQADGAFRAILNSSFMTTPDGMPLVWVGAIRGQKRMRRVYGPDYLIEMCRMSEQRGYRHFFFGGKAGIAVRLADKLKAKFPGLQVVGTYTPPFRPLTADEDRDLEALVAQAKPDVFWVGNKLTQTRAVYGGVLPKARRQTHGGGWCGVRYSFGKH